MNRDNEFLRFLLNGDSKTVEVSGPPINPYNQRATYIRSNLTPEIPDDPKIKNYSWELRKFDYDNSLEHPLLDRDVFKAAYPAEIDSSIIQTDNGNLTIFNVEPKKVYVFYANLFLNKSKTTRLNLFWADSLALILNDETIISNTAGLGYDNKFRDIYLTSGLNSIELFLYSYSGNINFTINNELGNIADGWFTPGFLYPITPTDIIIENDYNSNNKKDPNLNIIKWNQGSPTDLYRSTITLGHNVYRRGPYNSGLVVSNPEVSGYYETGIFGLRKTIGVKTYYSVSAENSNGESISTPSVEAIDPNTVLVPSVSGYYFNTGVAVSDILSGASFEYTLLARTKEKYWESNPFFVENILDNTVNITYTTGYGYDYIDVFRWSGGYDSTSGLYTPNNLDGTFQAYKIATITGIGNGLFVDSGLPEVGYQSGIPFYRRISAIFDIPIDTIDNTYRITWTGLLTGSLNGGYYNVYKTNYSGVYTQKSLIGRTTDTSFIDSGSIGPGKPIDYINVGSVDYSKTFNDTVLTNRTYDYKISSYNYSYVESPLSTGVTITAGDPLAPNTPSGVTITSFNGFVNIGWQNGVEPDLEGTIVYKSDDDVLYNEIGRTTSNTFSTFIGYSGGYPYFKLANYDTSDNISPLTSAYQGSGVFVAEKIVLTSMNLLKTIDIDLDLSIPSGLDDTPNSPVYPYRTQVFPISKDDITKKLNASSFLYAFSNKKSSPSTVYIAKDLAPDDFYDTKIHCDSGVSMGVIGDSSKWRAHIFYYSGTNNQVRMETYGDTGAVVTSASLISSKLLSGVAAGYFVNEDNTVGVTQRVAIGRPTVATMYKNPDYNIVVFPSGNATTTNPKLVFNAFNMNGDIISGPHFYNPLVGTPHEKGKRLGACIDLNSGVHVFTSNGARINWHKFSLTTGIGGTLTHQSTTETIMTTMPFYYQVENINAFVDRKNIIHLFFEQDISVLDGPFDIGYAAVDTSGNVLVKPKHLYSVPFPTNEFTVAYSYYNSLPSYDFDQLVQRDEAIACFSFNYDDINTRNGNSKLRYQDRYNDGGYTRRLIFERFTNGSLYQTLQSILK